MNNDVSKKSLIQTADLICGRCGKTIPFDEAECCWWCFEYLCPDPCWEKFGHCGHSEADALNERSRKIERLNRAISQNGRQKKMRETIEKLRNG